MIVSYEMNFKKMAIVTIAVLFIIGLFFMLNGCTIDTQIQPESNDTLSNIYEISEVDEIPKVLKSVPPQYPAEAKKEELEGFVKLEYIVTKKGKVTMVKVTESNPVGVFDQSAIEAIKKYSFKPALKDGKAVDVKSWGTLTYKLD